MNTYQCYLRTNPTEVWNFYNGDSRFIEPTIEHNYYSVGIGLYLVDENFCKK